MRRSCVINLFMYGLNRVYIKEEMVELVRFKEGEKFTRNALHFAAVSVPIQPCYRG